MNKIEAVKSVGRIYKGILGGSFDARGYVPKGTFLMIGAYEGANREWLGMGVARIRDGQSNLVWLRGIRMTNSGWFAPEAISITPDGRVVEYLTRMYFQDGVTVVGSSDEIVLHPNTIQREVEYLPLLSRQRRKVTLFDRVRWGWKALQNKWWPKPPIVML